MPVINSIDTKAKHLGQSLSGLFSNVTLRTKLVLGFGILMLLAAIEGIWGLHYTKVLNDRIEKIYSLEVLAIKNLGEIKSALHQIRIDTLEHILSNDAKTKESLLTKTNTNRQIIETGIIAYQKIAHSAVDKKLIQTFDTYFAEYADRTNNQVLVPSRAGNRSEAMARYRGELTQNFVDTDDTLSDLIDFNKHSAQT